MKSNNILFRHNLAKALLLGCIFSLITGQLSAQDKLTLGGAIQLGLANNYDIRIEAKNIEVARNNNKVGEAGFLPSLSANINQSNNWSDNANPNPFALQGKVFNTGITPSLNLNWTLFDGFRARITKDRLSNLQKDAEGNASIVVQNTIQSIIQGYYTAVLEKERLDVLQQSLDLSREKYQYVELKKDLGSAVTADLLLEEGNYLQDSSAYVNQLLTYRGALRTLNTLLAVDDLNTDYEFTDNLEFDDLVYQEDLLSERMTRNNVNLKRQYVSQALLKNATGLARASMYPRVSLSANVSENFSALDLSGTSNPDAPQVPVAGTSLSYGATFTVTYNLFNGGQIKRAIQNAVIQEEIGELRIDNLKLTLERDLKAALDLYNTRRMLKGIATRTKESAELNLKVSEERFKNGTINSFDYRTVQNNYINASLNELQAIYNLIDANTQILRITGGLVEDNGE